MLKAGDILHLGPLGMTFHIQRTAAETDGRALEMEWELAPGTGGTPVHIHPQAAETYEVLEGALDVFVDGTWQTLTAGQSVRVEPGVPHTFRSASDEPTRVYNAHEPAMKYGEYFEGLHKVANSGAISSARMTPKAILYLAVLMTSYEDEIRSVQPPHPVIRVLGAVGRLLGFRI
jgi:mannose-6-phosphate isomerase-like protein (cupin superfamily)